jgi:hypothetical protein
MTRKSLSETAVIWFISYDARSDMPLIRRASEASQRLCKIGCLFLAYFLHLMPWTEACKDWRSQRQQVTQLVLKRFSDIMQWWM